MANINILENMFKVMHSKKADSTRRSSQAVPHPSTNRALRRLTSEVGRDPVHSTRYGRQREMRQNILPWAIAPSRLMLSAKMDAKYLKRTCRYQNSTGGSSDAGNLHDYSDLEHIGQHAFPLGRV